MPTVIIQPTPRRRRSGGGGPVSKGPVVFLPPPVTLAPKNETLDRRIRNIEALGSGVFIGNILASYMALPGLVGFWPMSSVQRSTGNAYDLSGQGRTLTYNGNPAYTYHNGIVPYIDLDGTGDYLSRADETDLDITGAETIFTSGAAGVTMGGWFWLDSVSGSQGLITKGDGGSNAGSSWALFYNTVPQFQVYNSTDAVTAAGAALSTGQWYFIAARFTPSTSVDIWINATQSTTVTAFASANSTAANFNVGALAAGSVLDGRATLCFLCANAIGDDLVSSLYQTSRIIFSV